MSRLSLLLAAGMCVATSSAARAQDEPAAPVPGPADPGAATEPAQAATAGEPGADAAPAPGVTADVIAGMPRLAPADRAAMRADCEAGAARCDRLALLGRLERAALVRALRARGLVVDPAPAGKRIGRILVVTLPPFGAEVPWLEWANVFHVDSKASIIAREVLARPGEPWRQDVVDESQRKLRDPLFASVAVIVAVRGAGAADDGAVDLLVVNRDVFSVRLNTNYLVQDGKLTDLTLSLSENNFLGRRKLAALSLVMDQGAVSIGPLYIDKNLLGRRLDFRFRGGPIFSRSSGDLEGSEGTVTLSRPLWSLASKWSWRLDATRGNTVERSFRGTSIRRFDAEATPGDDALPWRYRLRRWSVGGGVTRAWGERYEQRLTVNYDLSSRRPVLQDDVTGDPAALAEFAAEVLPRSERAGLASISYEIFTPRYRDYVDVDSFDLAEDVRLGPRVELGAGVAPSFLGTEQPFGRLSIDGGWTVPWGGDGLASLAASFSTRLEGGAAIDRTAAATLRVVSPATRVGRLVGEVRVAGLFREQGNRFYTLGSDTGLRGFTVGAFKGERRAVAQVEARSRSVRFLFGIRLGAVVFYDAGHAADTLAQLSIQHDVGLGVRSLTPQLSREVFRFDLATALTGPERGHPRLILGFRQAF